MTSWLKDHHGAIRAALYLDVPPDELVRRIVARGRESGRGDDRANVAGRRIDVYEDRLPQVVHHYAERGLLQAIDGTLPIDEVQRRVIQSLEQPRS